MDVCTSLEISNPKKKTRSKLKKCLCLEHVYHLNKDVSASESWPRCMGFGAGYAELSDVLVTCDLTFFSFQIAMNNPIHFYSMLAAVS